MAEQKFIRLDGLNAPLFASEKGRPGRYATGAGSIAVKFLQLDGKLVAQVLQRGRRTTLPQRIAKGIAHGVALRLSELLAADWRRYAPINRFLRLWKLDFLGAAIKAPTRAGQCVRIRGTGVIPQLFVHRLYGFNQQLAQLIRAFSGGNVAASRAGVLIVHFNLLGN